LLLEDNDWDFTVDEAADFTDPINPAATPMRLYTASKLLANNASWDFWKTAKPHYALVTIHPSFVFGHNLVQTSAEKINGSTNGLLWKTIMTGTPAGSVTNVHVQDVAEAHVKALSPEIVGGSKYLISGKRATWGDVAQIVQKHYPHIGAGISADIEGTSWPTDTTRAEKDLNMKWRSLEQIVREVVDQQLSFVTR
jgi:nucleoside-diphosphate-sugar epimerase